KGLTTTSANHIANLAKEMIQEMETSLAELTFYSITVTLISVAEPNVLNKGDTDADVEAVSPGTPHILPLFYCNERCCIVLQHSFIIIVVQLNNFC
ncbi:MAG: hypothetical protein K2G29_06095, partial [Muribaculaceae bacterium]|nr:hypothetical protein [Muribaculaceae bacterium]